MIKYLQIFLFLFTIQLHTQQRINTNWSQPEMIYNNDIFSSGLISAKNIVTFGDEGVFILYNLLNENGNIDQTYYIMSDDGINWSSPKLFLESFKNIKINLPILLTDSQKRIHIIWENDLSNEVYYSNFDKDEFSKPIKLSSDKTRGVFGKSILIDGSDNIHICWSANADSEIAKVFYTKSFSNGDSFSVAKIVNPKENKNSKYPKFIFNGNNSEMNGMTWLNYAENQSSGIVSAISKNDGETWIINPKIKNEKNLFNQIMYVDQYDNFVLIYEKLNEENIKSIWSCVSYDDGESWTDPERISRVDRNSNSAKIEYDINNEVYWLAWKEIDKSKSYSVIMEAYSIDGGLNWSVPETVINSNQMAIDLKNLNMEENGILRINYDLHDNVSGISEVYSQIRDTEQVKEKFSIKRTKKEFDYIFAFPNPAVDQVVIKFECKMNGEYEVCIYNILGEKMKASKKYFHQGQCEVKFFINDLLPGIYFYSLIGNDKVVTGKLTKIDY